VLVEKWITATENRLAGKLKGAALKHHYRANRGVPSLTEQNGARRANGPHCNPSRVQATGGISLMCRGAGAHTCSEPFQVLPVYGPAIV
jgi:hypothetical protein